MPLTKQEREMVSKLDAAIREDLTLYPIIVKSEAEYANLARVLKLSSNVGIPRTFVLFTTGFLDPQYRRFITRRLREVWGFEGSPINVSMRVREKRGPRK
jgi:GTP-binding protein